MCLLHFYEYIWGMFAIAREKRKYIQLMITLLYLMYWVFVFLMYWVLGI